MMGEVAHDVGVSLHVLAASGDDPALLTCDVAVLGAANDAHALDELAHDVDVVTFDHELVDLDQLRALEARGVVLRPSASTLAHSVDKAHQRRAFAAAGLPVPRFAVVEHADDPAIATFVDEVGVPVVKAARGGYDGRGVVFPPDAPGVADVVATMLAAGTVVLEERLALQCEVAQLVARDVHGDVATYPLVTTVQDDGMCVEVRMPCALDQRLHHEAAALARRIAELIDAVGVLAVEYFVVGDELVVNEIALRPHNSGHWSIEGAVTSQFANHLRCVSGQRVASGAANCPAAVMVNVVGADEPGSIEAARGVAGAHVHDYAKSWRPGRKLGHVTVVGDDERSAHVRAWESALAYGTRTREA